MNKTVIKLEDIIWIWVIKMKRSTTPALRDKGITVKSQANLKLPSQLKILNK